MPTHSTTIDAQEVLQRWLGACASNPWASLTEQAAQPYAYIWQSWVRHIAPKDWTQAEGVDVLAFLASVEQVSKTKHSASDTTRRRYWRVLDRVYEHAQLHGWCDANPAQQVAESERPPQESPTGAVLTMRMWAALRDGLPAPADAITARDRAALMLLMELGITSQELYSLTLQDVDGQRLHLHGPRQPQNRTMTMSEALSGALSDYLRQRPMLGAVARSESLFVSREEPKWAAQSVQRVTTKYMRAIAYRNKLPEPVSLGAQIIRNTALLHWLLDGQPMSEVVRLAGLKSPHAFTHLRQHLPPNLRAIVATSGIDAD